MANSITLTVAQMRQLVAQIPVNRNNSLVVVPPDAPLFPVVADYVIAPDGSEFFTVQGYLDFATQSYNPVV